MQAVALLGLLALAQATTVTLASWNIQDLGVTKIGRPEVVKMITTILVRYALCENALLSLDSFVHSVCVTVHSWIELSKRGVLTHVSFFCALFFRLIFSASFFQI